VVFREDTNEFDLNKKEIDDSNSKVTHINSNSIYYKIIKNSLNYPYISR